MEDFRFQNGVQTSGLVVEIIPATSLQLQAGEETLPVFGVPLTGDQDPGCGVSRYITGFQDLRWYSPSS